MHLVIPNVTDNINNTLFVVVFRSVICCAAGTHILQWYFTTKYLLSVVSQIMVFMQVKILLYPIKTLYGQ